MLSTYIRGASHRAMATLFGISEDASRQRWMRIRKELEAWFTEGTLDG